MATFIKLEDSPMFQKQVCALENNADELKDRCQRLHKGCKKFMAALGEACIGDTTFADSLEAFGGGQDDPVSVSIGGPVISKFINAFRELATYKEFLRSQVEHVLTDRLMDFMNVDLQDAKESRRRFDKSVHAYDQAREKFVSLKKNTRVDIIEEMEEDLQNSKSAFEKSRFNLVSALMNIEAKKKYQFLESISAIMDSHLRYFKLGYELFSQMEPYIHQVLTYTQQSKEQTNIEQDKLAKRIQEFRTQSELENLKASSDKEPSPSADGTHVVGMASYRNIEAVMQSTAHGETIKQGYLLKRSSSLRGDWKRRFFVLDGQGTLYYHRSKGMNPMGFQSHRLTGSVDNNSSVFGRFRSKHNSSSSFSEETLGCCTVDLCTATIKMDAEDTDLRLCFRIISPSKTYTLQAENATDRMDWVNKITGAIASLLNSHFLQQPHPGIKRLENDPANGASCVSRSLDSRKYSEQDVTVDGADCVSRVFREIPGNHICAECGTPKPDWASLNLGILLCIGCSGIHRNLGVHISKVRSLTLDVKVWEPTIVDLFCTLGNTFCNSIWEGLLLPGNKRMTENAMITSIMKPSPKDDIHQKERFIQAKYVEKSLIIRETAISGIPSAGTSIWEAVEKNNLREVYRLIVASDVNIISTTFNDVVGVDSYHHSVGAQDSIDYCISEDKQYDPTTCQRIKDSNDPGSCLQGCSLLHLACRCGNPIMVELLLQFRADVNLRDYHGRTPLHHCICCGKNSLAKLLLRRGARPSIEDGGGLSVLERAMEMGAITDEELFLMLAETS